MKSTLRFAALSLVLITAFFSVSAVDNPNIAGRPAAALIEGPDGNFYGTTAAGGSQDFGTVFRMTPAGQLTTLINFSGTNSGANRGDTPLGALIVASDGNFYGTTAGGGVHGHGTVFRLTQNGVLTTLVDFTNSTSVSDNARGAAPHAGLVEDPAALGTFYGTTSAGGVTGRGTIFRLVLSSNALTAYDFTGANGSQPEASLLKARDGFFYGTTFSGGAGSRGVVFRFDPASATAITPIRQFAGGPADGANPYAELIQGRGSDSTLYGTTAAGGANDRGTIYRISTAGAFTLLHSFTAPAGRFPVAGLTPGSGTDTNFYGATVAGGASDLGTVFQFLTVPSPQLKTLFSFGVDGNGNTPNGFAPEGTLLRATDGFYYGTTASGGAGNSGTAFRLTSVGVATLVSFNAPPALAPVINSPLTATAQQPEPNDPGATPTFNYQITATNTPTLFGVQGLPSGLSINTVTGLISGKPQASGTFTVLISATNSGGSDSETLTLKVVPPRPVITSPANVIISQGATLNYQITANNNPTNYNAFTLPNGLAVNTSTGVITGVFRDAAGNPVAGDFSFTIQATNEGGTGSLTLTVSVVPPAPVITSPSTASGVANEPFSYQITATNFPTTYEAQGLPPGIFLDSTSGVIAGETRFAGVYTVLLAASNRGGRATKELTLTIAPARPEITSPDFANAQQGEFFTYQITATNNPTSFGASGLPAGLSVDSSSGVISGTPTVNGEFNVQIFASNAGGTVSKTLRLTIQPSVPVITSASAASGQIDRGFTYQITATNRPTSYDADGLPEGLQVTRNTGVISGIPKVTGTFSVVLSASNARGTGTQILTLTIFGGSPVITSPTTAKGQENVFFTYQITATNNPTSYDAFGLPAGLTVNRSSGLISGTPTVSGTFNVQISASHGGGTGSATLALSITPAGITLVQFRNGAYSATSSDNSVTLIVDLNRAAGDNGAFAVDYATADGSAQAGRDYQPQSGTLSFGPGESQRSITISLIPRGEPSDDRTFSVALANPSRGVIGRNSATVTISSPDLATKLLNISTRAPVRGGEEVMIAGFIIHGSAQKQIVLRGIGPSLTDKGVPTAVSDPTLTLMDSNGAQIAFNDDHQTNSIADQQTINANGLAPQDERESAIVATLAPGTYTAILRGKTNGTGLVEVYDISRTTASRFVNIATRSRVNEGDNGAMIAGIIVGSPEGQPGSTQRLVIRAIGPSLASAGITDVLDNPTLEIYRGTQKILENDDWKTDQRQALQATGLAPTKDKEAAVLIDLEPGSYSAVIRSKNGTTGVAVAEVYQLSE
jgi:uncharacterized repeat protein (TIGR03803 family)